MKPPNPKQYMATEFAFSTIFAAGMPDSRSSSNFDVPAVNHCARIHHFGGALGLTGVVDTSIN